jgi:N-acyl homoserine lactone hydrolase
LAGNAVARKMFLLQYGQEPVPKWISVRGAGSEIMWEPIVSIAVETDDGWVLLESGIGRRFLEDRERLTGIYRWGEEPWAVAGDPLVTVLKEVGLEPGQFIGAAISHLHVDHSGGIRTLAEAGVPIYIQREELAFGREGAKLTDGYYKPDYTEFPVEWRELTGDAEIAPGVWVLSTRGHTPGHMSYRVDLPHTGPWLFAADAADLAENFTDRKPPGRCVLREDWPRAIMAIERLLEEKDRLGARLVPGHDQLFWDAVKHPPGGYV